MKMALKWFLAVLVLMGCSIKLDPALNVNPKLDPRMNVQNAAGNSQVTQNSKAAAVNGTKKYGINVYWKSQLSAALNISETYNCVQYVQLATGEQVVDFAAVTCPANDGLLDPNAILFSLDWVDLGNGQASLMLAGMKLGSLDYDWSFPAAQLTALCTAEFSGLCTVSSQNLRITRLDKR